jgi:hypothetical protein
MSAIPSVEKYNKELQLMAGLVELAISTHTGYLYINTDQVETENGFIPPSVAVYHHDDLRCTILARLKDHAPFTTVPSVFLIVLDESLRLPTEIEIQRNFVLDLRDIKLTMTTAELVDEVEAQLVRHRL